MDNKRKPRFNLFDVVIIVLVLAALGAALMLRNRSTGDAAVGGPETHPMRYTVEFTDVQHEMAASITIGDGAYRSTDGQYLGTIVDVSTLPHEKIEYSTAAGRFVLFTCEDVDDLYLTIENEGYCTGKDIMIGGVSAKVGTDLTIKGRGFARGGYIYSVDTMGVPVPEDTAAQAGEQEAEFVIRFGDCRPFVADNIHVGDRFYDKHLGAMVGEVTRVETEPYGETRLTSSGASVYAEKANRCNVLVTMKGRYLDKPDSLYLDAATELKVGATTKLVSNYLEREGLFYEIVSLGN